MIEQASEMMSTPNAPVGPNNDDPIDGGHAGSSIKKHDHNDGLPQPDKAPGLRGGGRSSKYGRRMMEELTKNMGYIGAGGYPPGGSSGYPDMNTTIRNPLDRWGIMELNHYNRIRDYMLPNYPGVPTPGQDPFLDHLRREAAAGPIPGARIKPFGQNQLFGQDLQNMMARYARGPSADDEFAMAMQAEHAQERWLKKHG